MANRVRFSLRKAGVDEVMRSPKMGALVGTKLRQAKAATEANAPRGDGFPHYANSIETDGPRLERDGWVGELYSTDPFASIIEFGSQNNPPYRPLTRGVEEAGLEYEDTGP